MKRVITILTITTFFVSCAGSSKVGSNNTTAKTTRKKTACGGGHVNMNQPHIDWFEENASVLNSATEILVLPKKYKVYSADSTQVATFFHAIQNNTSMSTVLPLPEPAGCQVFAVKNNVKEGQKVPPGVIMAAGDAKDQKMGISYYRGEITAHVNWFDIEYEMSTKNIKGTNYYLVYEKAPLPATPLNNQKKEQARPEIVEFRYDK